MTESGSPLQSYFQTLARYGEWATRRLLEHVDALPEFDYRRDTGLFFKSVHGTLNHLLVAEHLIWRRRFAEGVSPKMQLHEQAESDRVRLRERLIEGAQAWAPLITSWDAARFGAMLGYTTTKGVSQALPFAATLGHVFNHASHHRGQISAALTALGRPCPELDLVGMLQAESASP